MLKYVYFTFYWVSTARALLTISTLVSHFCELVSVCWGLQSKCQYELWCEFLHSPYPCEEVLCWLHLLPKLWSSEKTVTAINTHWNQEVVPEYSVWQKFQLRQLFSSSFNFIPFPSNIASEYFKRPGVSFCLFFVTEKFDKKAITFHRCFTFILHKIHLYGSITVYMLTIVFIIKASITLRSMLLLIYEYKTNYNNLIFILYVNTWNI